ncbi:MAG: hypothetical protein H6Q33_3424 [Deltaproteobacteria bacterium]|nr:hypothetical protein [Deltaproteobacteria bacterium]
MKRALCIATVLFVAVAAHAADKKEGGGKTALSPLLPAGAQPEAVVILKKNDQGQMAPGVFGKLHNITIEKDGQQVEQPDALAQGNIVIIRDIDDVMAKSLRIVNGTVQVGGAYIANANHELEYLGQVDLTKENKQLAKEFGIRGERVKKAK